MDEKTLKEIASLKGMEPKVKEVYDALLGFRHSQARQDWILRRTEAWEAIENKMWPEKDEKAVNKEKQEATVFNKCNKGVQGSTAIVTDQKPEIKFNPVGSADRYVAEILKRGHDFIWDKNEGQDVVYESVEECKIGGLSWFSSHFDPGKGIFGSVVMDVEPPEDIFFDAESRKRDFSDSHIIKAKLRTKSYLKAVYGDQIKDEDLIYFKGLGQDEDQRSTGSTTEDNYTIKSDGEAPDGPTIYREPKQHYEIEAWMLEIRKEKGTWYGEGTSVRWLGESELETVAKEQGKTVQELLDAAEGEVVERIREVRKLRIIVGKKLIQHQITDEGAVDELVNPYGEDCDGKPVIGLVPLRSQRTRTAYPMSPTMYALPINRDKNKRRAQFSLHLAHNVNSPIIQPAKGMNWDGNPGTPGSVGTMSATAAFKPYRLEPGTFQVQHFIEIETMDDREIDDQYDMADVLRGKLPKGQGQVAGKTVIALQDFAGMMSKPFLRALESSLVRVSKVNMAIAFRHWPRIMWDRLIEPDELWIPDDEKQQLELKAQAYPAEDPTLDPQNQAIIKARWIEALERIKPKDGEPDISILTIDVKMVAGSSMPTNRMAKEVIALERVGQGVYDVKAFLEYVDDPDADKIAARIEAKEQALIEAEKTKQMGGTP